MEVLAENLIGEDTVRHLLQSFYGNFAHRFYIVRYWYSNSVRPSVCPWRSGIGWKRPNIFFTIR